jgi:chromosome segregation protein
MEERKAAAKFVVDRHEDYKNQFAGLTASFGELNAEINLLRKQESEGLKLFGDINTLLEPNEQKLKQEEKSQNELEKAETQARQSMSALYRQYSQSQLQLSRTEEQLERLRIRIEDDLGLVNFEYGEEVTGPTPLPFFGLVESLPKLQILPDDMEKAIKRQRAQVKRMGSINPEAQVEYQSVLERHTFLTNQIEDLKAAEQDVRMVITELETIMVEEFQKTFNLVAAEFKNIFTRLFGGGNAQLVLTTPAELTDTGIDIEARLPGRRTQGLSLLSGGERSLTATALIFALLKVSPTPFCVLDEVDAMLDETNVERFRGLLKELAAETQFIVITHNRNTVQAADVIYGVTMGRDSVSQTVSMKLDDVVELV